MLPNAKWINECTLACWRAETGKKPSSHLQICSQVQLADAPVVQAVLADLPPGTLT